MNCFNCKEPISDTPRPHKTIWSTHPPVFVRCLSYSCEACGEIEIEIIRVHRLAQRVAEAIAHLPHHLAECQIYYLLKHLDLSLDEAHKRFNIPLVSGEMILEWPLRKAVTLESEGLVPFTGKTLDEDAMIFPLPPRPIPPMTFSYTNGDWYEEK